MLRQPIQNFIRFCLVVSCATLVLAPLLNAEAISYRSYTAPEGTHYFAFGLQVPAQSAHQPSEVVFLVDTAASQMGQVRLDTLEAIVSTINHLPEGTRIQILAMDVVTEPLTAQFYVKGSPELEAALRTLHRRVPLGATDFGKGLEAARTAFESGLGDTRRAVLYFGSGRSMARTLAPAVFEREAQYFVEQRIPFTVCAVGLQANLGFTAAFANRTGGNLINMSPIALAEEAMDWGEEIAGTRRMVDGVERVDWRVGGVDWDRVDWNRIGQQIADSATATVVWVDPASVQFPEGVYVFPVQMQPIRSDRATILVGATESETLPTFNLALTGTTAEGEVALPFQLTAAEQISGDNYLQIVVELASRDGGALMPIVGWDSMLHIQEMFIANVENQINKAEAAIATGNLREAQVLLDGVLRVEPSNRIARNLFDLAEEQILANVMAQNGNGAPAGAAPANIAPMGVAPSGFAGTAPAPVALAPAAFVDAAMGERALVSQKINNEVRQAITDAERQAGGIDPHFDAIVQNLRLTQQMVRGNTVLAPAERDSLLDRLGNTLRQVEHERNAREIRSIQEETNRARHRSLQEANRVFGEDQEKTIQIFARFDALMRVGEYRAAWAVGDEAVEMMPNHPAPYIARRLAQMINYIEEYRELRHRRHVGFLETFMAVERSFVPVPPDPPITFIDRDRWQLLSDYRRERYSTVALSDPDEMVKTIQAILESRDIRLHVDETTTFSDLFQMIKSELRRLRMPDILIELDRRALQDANEIRSDSLLLTQGETTFNHPRMRFRSALSRLLSPHDLTYIIRDETLLITTIEESRRRENMIIKVYPVADIMLLEQGGMMGMGGGMMGGMGGGMGGMGGGMGGMGGGMMGGRGGMGGMGGGFGGGWSIPDEITRSVTARTSQLLQDARSAEDSGVFWTNYFAQANVNHELIHDVVRRLSRSMQSTGQTNRQDAEQIVALAEAAILSGNAQPWMYEALTLSLYLKGAPTAQILRAALSAADFCQNPVDLLNVGFVMREKLGLGRYAFPLYQQALENMPPRRELYAATLRLAQELFDRYNDEEPLRWIGLAILSQVWDGRLGERLSLDANDALVMLGNRLIRQGRSAEAEQLAMEMREAKLRDIIVMVEWTGDAGIDLMVREPSNSICWFGNPRSLSGGLLKTSSAINSARISNQSDTRRVSYVVPRGFNGTYSLVLNRSWGTIANDLVNVTVETNTVPGEGQSPGVAFRMDPEGVIIDFDLETGRRTESVSEAELAATAVRMDVAQQVVNRNAVLWRLVDDGVLGQAADDDAGAGAGAGAGTPPPPPTPAVAPAAVATVPGAALLANPNITEFLWGGRYVGYAPVVEVLDVGTELFMMPVAVSPDRRYVLMNLSPTFTTLRDVREFGTGIGGGGGGGGIGGGGFGGGGMGGGGFGGGGMGGGFGGGGFGGGGMGGGGGFGGGGMGGGGFGGGGMGGGGFGGGGGW